MATPTLDQDIQSRIQSFLGELSVLVRKSALEAVHVALGEGAAPSRRGRPQKAMRRARRAVARTGKRVRRSAEDLEQIATRVLAHVKANAGHRLEQIGKALMVETAVLKRPVANLLAARKLRTKGQKRGTMYFAGGGRGSARKAKGGARRKSAVRAGRKAKRGRKVSSKRTNRRPAKAKALASTPATAAA